MAQIDKPQLQSNYQNPGDIYSDGATESCFELIADAHNETDQRLTAAAAPGAVDTIRIADRAVTGSKIAPGAVGANQLDPSLLQQYGDIATNAKFEQIETSLEATSNNTTVVSIENFGAVGDYNINSGSGTDDTAAIQRGIDFLFQSGGGILYFPNPAYRITAPLLMKLPASDGGYDYPSVVLMGRANRGSMIVKTGTAQSYSVDATVILIKGSTLSLADAFSGAGFDNIKIHNASTAATTYGVYGDNGSRIRANYSSFSTIKDLATVSSHNRYAFYIRSTWALSIRDSTFSGDYGFYNAQNSTSILLENCFATTDKVGYHIVGVYSTLINTYGDFCNGILYHFDFASVHCTAIAGESQNCTEMIRATNSDITIDNAYFIQSNSPTGTVLYCNGSALRIKQLNIKMQNSSMGFLWKGGIKSRIEVNKMALEGTSRFTQSDAPNMSTNAMSVQVLPGEGPVTRGLTTILPHRTTQFWDWYMETPTIPVSNVIMGLKNPTTLSDGSNVQFDASGYLNGLYINSNPSERNVFGWTRYAQTSTALNSGSNYYIPFILSGTTANRPTWRTTGMNYFDTTINKPVWWNGSNWVDATGTNV